MPLNNEKSKVRLISSLETIEGENVDRSYLVFASALQAPMSSPESIANLVVLQLNDVGPWNMPPFLIVCRKGN